MNVKSGEYSGCSNDAYFSFNFLVTKASDVLMQDDCFFLSNSGLTILFRRAGQEDVFFNYCCSSFKVKNLRISFASQKILTLTFRPHSSDLFFFNKATDFDPTASTVRLF